MIRNIVFDIGNVLVDFRWKEYIADCGFQGETVERLGKAMMQSPVWAEGDRGVWTEEELLQGFIRNDPDLEEQIRRIYADIGPIVRQRPGSVDWIRSLKQKGYGVYYLSNYSEKGRRETEADLTFMKEMDGGIMSYEVRLIKPDPAIYRLLFERYGLKPEESVFLDDTAANVEAAAELGMYGILVTSQEQARMDLEELLEQIKE